MKREELLAYIWEEKREKVIGGGSYPIGISITIENLNFHWHTVIYGILSALMKNPKQALEWSRHWGRTMVWLHPNKSLSFKFTEKKSPEEKLGVLVDTESIINPVEFLNFHYNIGHFKILLNWRRLSLEGAILQVSRMVDELVWCNFLKLKKHKINKLSEIDIYIDALNEVWRSGILVEYLPERQILDMKRKNMSLPVRIYGNVRKNKKVPKVIGAVVIPQSKTDDELSDCKETLKDQQEEILSVIDGSQSQLRTYPVLPTTSIHNKESCICTAIILAKKLHTGHLLLLGFADLVRRVIGSNRPLYLESNDSGKRIFALINRMMEEYKSSAESVISSLVNRRYSPEEIDFCYRTRREQAETFQEVQKKLKRNKFNLLAVMNEKVERDLKLYGFKQVSIIPDSICLQKHDELIELVKEQQWKRNLGFRFVKYIQGKHKKMAILEKRSVPTASAIRAAFVNTVLSLNKVDATPIFIDADPSVVQACDLLGLVYGKNLLRLEGAAIGFEMKIGSGTAGNVISAEFLYRLFCKEFSEKRYPNFFLSVVTFFLLTRYATAKAHKEQALAKGHPIGVSFYDYKNKQALLNDFLLCAKELLIYNNSIKKAKQSINSLISKGYKGIEFKEGRDNKKNKMFLTRLEKIGAEKIFDQIFPTPKAESVSNPLRQVREAIHRQHSADDSQLIDRIIIELIIHGHDTVGELSNILLSKRLIHKPIPGGKNQKLSCIFVENLKSRGYGANVEEIINHILSYLNGDFCLLKKKCIYFEILEDIIAFTDDVISLDNTSVKIIQKALSVCIKKLNFS